MKRLNTYFEGLLDKDFVGPDFDYEPISPNIPAFVDDGEYWRITVDKINKKLAPYKYYAKINDVIISAKKLINELKVDNVSTSSLGKVGSALITLAGCGQFNLEDNPFEEAKVARELNDWIDNANKDSEFKKIVSGLGGYFHCTIDTRRGYVFGSLVYTLISPNKNAQDQLKKLANKMSKINPAIEIKFDMNGEGDGLFAVKIKRSV